MKKKEAFKDYGIGEGYCFELNLTDKWMRSCSSYGPDDKPMRSHRAPPKAIPGNQCPVIAKERAEAKTKRELEKEVAKQERIEERQQVKDERAQQKAKEKAEKEALRKNKALKKLEQRDSRSKAQEEKERKRDAKRKAKVEKQIEKAQPNVEDQSNGDNKPKPQKPFGAPSKANVAQSLSARQFRKQQAQLYDAAMDDFVHKPLRESEITVANGYGTEKRKTVIKRDKDGTIRQPKTI